VVDSKGVRTEEDLCATTEQRYGGTVQIESRPDPDQDVFESSVLHDQCSAQSSQATALHPPAWPSAVECTGGIQSWVGADAPITANTAPEGVIQMLQGSEGSMHVLLPFWCECKMRATTNNQIRDGV
jgi:hypothetical protein